VAYTQDDLAAVRAAIVKLATGQMRVTVSFSSAAGSRTVTYKSANLDELRKLEQEIADDLEPKPRSRTILTRARKGL